MTNEQWLQAEKALSNLYGYARLKIDGYDVLIRLERWGKYALAMVVYVNETIELENLTEDCEKRRRFYCRKEKSLLTQKGKAALKKESKKFQKRFAEEHNLSYEYFVPVWKSFRSMKNHFIKNNKSIEVVEIV